MKIKNFLRRIRKHIWYFIQNCFKLIGIDIFPKRVGYSYLPLIETPAFFGKSAHKLVDIRQSPDFGELAKTVIQHNRTYLYFDRLFTLFQMMKNLPPKTKQEKKVHFAEVGVHRGGGSYFIAACAEKLGIDNMQLHSFDTFEGHAAQDIQPGMDGEHQGGGFGNVDFEDVIKYLSEFPNIAVYKGRFQDTSSQIDKNKFHFVHLDVDIYEPTLLALHFFHHRLTLHGVVIVDDYGFTTCPGVKKAISEFLEGQDDYFCFPLLTGQFVMIKMRE